METTKIVGTSPYVMPGLKRAWMPALVNITNKEVLMNDITEIICRHFKVEKTYFEGETNTREVIRRRFIIWSIMRLKVPNITLNEIGCYFKGTVYSHGNVIHGIRKVKNDPQLNYIKQLYF